MEFLLFLRYEFIRGYFGFLFYAWQFFITGINFAYIPIDIVTDYLFKFTVFPKGLFLNFLDDTLDEI